MTDAFSAPARKKVAIVGGGCAALSAAMELSDPKHQGQYEISVYQMGWRLGGKGASSRGPSGRIEEHGLHLWLGFYENAFRHMRQCYKELDREPGQCPIATFEDAFTPDPVISVAEENDVAGWDVWSIEFPPGEGEPGTAMPGDGVYSVSGYLQRVFGVALSAFDSLDKGFARESGVDRRADVRQQAEQVLALGKLTGLAGMLVTIELIQASLGQLGSGAESIVRRLTDRAHEYVRQQIELQAFADPRVRRLWRVMDVLLAATRGVVRFGLLSDERGFDAIDDYDWMEWLSFNGAAEDSVNAPFVRASLYDLTFAYKGGDPEQPAFAAGGGFALRIALVPYLSWGDVLEDAGWMGDVVFAPLYQVLKKRGVKFHFFHRLTDVRLADDRLGKHIGALHFDVQAELKVAEYYPLIEVKGLPVWPDRPRYELLEGTDWSNADPTLFEVEAEQDDCRKLRLEVGKDFDFVVLGVSLGSIRSCCAELVERDSRWSDMVDNVATVGTQALQLWMRPEMSKLGFAGSSGNLSGFVTPFDTWADMSHLARVEDWAEAPGSIAYFCSALKDSDLPANSRRVAKTSAVFVCEELPHLWPGLPPYLASKNLFLTHSPDPCPQQGGFEQQYFRANSVGSERYVQSLPGTTRYRLSPLDRTYDNMTIAGDWTQNGLNAGCVEAAVMSGMLAAHAISGFPALEEVIGYDHP